MPKAEPKDTDDLEFELIGAAAAEAEKVILTIEGHRVLTITTDNLTPAFRDLVADFADELRAIGFLSYNP